jgi:hypothetical protein
VTAPIAGVGRKFTTENRNDKLDLLNHRVLAGKQVGMRQRSSKDIWEEHLREIENHIETGE